MQTFTLPTTKKFIHLIRLRCDLFYIRLKVIVIILLLLCTKHIHRLFMQIACINHVNYP